MNKSEHTPELKQNEETSLTPLQEKAVYLFASGTNVTDTAKELNINRATIYHWQKLSAFEGFYNRVRTEAKEQTKNELFNLLGKALTTLKDCLNSENEAVKLKTAIYILEQKNIYFGSVSKEDIETERRNAPWV